MRLFFSSQSADREDAVDAPSGDSGLWCATVVLQHDDGHVGFDALRGAEAMHALVRGGGVIVELANSPAWSVPDISPLPAQIRRAGLKGVVTCTGPRPPLLHELEAVSANRRRAKQNLTLTRHGREPLPLTPTFFDDWITPEQRVRLGVIDTLANGCDLVTHWWFSDRGLHARCFGLTNDLAIAPILRAAEELHLPVTQVATSSELPTW